MMYYSIAKTNVLEAKMVHSMSLIAIAIDVKQRGHTIMNVVRNNIIPCANNEANKIKDNQATSEGIWLLVFGLV